MRFDLELCAIHAAWPRVLTQRAARRAPCRCAALDCRDAVLGLTAALRFYLGQVVPRHRSGAGHRRERGFDGDREWMIVDARARFITQRSHPQLARIATAFDGTTLRLTHPDLGALAIRARAAAEARMLRVTVWNDSVDAFDCGDEAAAWLSRAIGASVTLVQAGTATRRQPEARWRGEIAAPVNFPDAFPLLVCSLASLADLNRRMPQPVPIDRFRPNIVLDGLPAYGEDACRGLRIGAVSLRLVKPCTRCATTAVDQQDGSPGSNPLPVLRSYRFDRELLGVTFGQNAVIAAGRGALLRRGDVVEPD
ncbi:MAG: MOSC domain-containing protein [Steroidobacteraceae bacterium]